jgi:Fur family iron response transcriptional regulator
VIVGPISNRAQIIDLLKAVGLKATQQRIALGWLLFSGNGKHTTADMLYAEARVANRYVSLATIYNTLQAFVKVGLLRSISFKGSIVFDTNPVDHHHFIVDCEHRLIDISSTDVAIDALPKAPEGYEISRVEVLVHVTPISKFLPLTNVRALSKENRTPDG